MCGIVGILSVGGNAEVDPSCLRRMAGTLVHRGPDDEGFFLRPNIGLGNRRLAIIDLGRGRQPICTPGERFVIVYNGEIFNYLSLREELLRKGVQFRTKSDTELLLAGFARTGTSFLERLEGMYAFLIYDTRERVLFAARDPFGIKPLYWQRQGSFLYLASEIRAIRSGTGAEAAIDEESAASYFLCGYAAGSHTFFRGIRRVPPGVLLTIGTDGTVSERPFGDRISPAALSAAPPLPKNTLKDTLVSAVERSLVSDVPVGLYLSGGIDSSLIAAIVSRELGKTLRTFSVRFPEDPGYDEGSVAQAVAGELGLPFEKVTVGPEDFQDLRRLASDLEEPLADPSAAALACLSALTVKHLKVVLSGEGGDELFGGYHRYFWDRGIFRRAAIFPFGIPLLRLAAQVTPWTRVRRRTEKFIETAPLPRSARYCSWFSPFKREERERLFVRSVFRPERTLNVFARSFDAADPLPDDVQARWVDMTTFLRDDLLIKADRMSMVHGVEARVPFLQSDVVAAAFSSRRCRLEHRFRTKPELRNLLAAYLPPKIVRRRKQGFEIPLDRWFRGPLEPLLDRYCSERIVKKRGLLDWSVVRDIRAAHASRSHDRGLALFALALFEAWCQAFLDGSKQP